MSKVHVVVTNYLVTQEAPSCEVFVFGSDARDYVLQSIKRDVTESDRYTDPIWKERVLKACDEAIPALGDTELTLYQYAVECYNDTGDNPQYEEYWIFAREAQ